MHMNCYLLFCFLVFFWGGVVLIFLNSGCIQVKRPGFGGGHTAAM